MNSNTRETILLRAKAKAQSLRNRVVVFGAAFATAPAFAMAADGDFDVSTILSKVTLYGGYALAIILGFAAAVWGLRAAGLIGGRR
ncbi:hypothetical protein NB688_002845 [Xanthomonas sacchari]|uniref:Phage coat protein n=1 Tax=Xanthomonas sacchari TaxID=56458 RepID=A0ABT3DWT8_9XANT|nr:hypothetical protein [Xanthomonas sacchari]MCW0399816.1 hypothetical protein [Xanthomonas sacchari]MCW0420679.1 hypothetical protein [Xanthomonas sacchari]MDQ1093164.1 hypothetical protein [Xanthomonas sacchari]UYK74724.1 hypothetical protein NG828_10650 [Xanthomonas sacchari]